MVLAGKQRLAADRIPGEAVLTGKKRPNLNFSSLGYPAAFFDALHYPKTHQKCYTDFIETFSNNPNKKVGMTIE